MSLPLAGTPLGRGGMLLVASHKGGTGQTTTAAALARCWADQGHRVALVLATAAGAASPPASEDPRLAIAAAADPLRLRWPAADVIVVDGPALTEPSAQVLLASASAVLLTVLADPLSLRTLGAATAAVAAARNGNPALRVAGLAVTQYQPADELQLLLLAQVQRDWPGVLLTPPVPYQRDMGAWITRPASPLPGGAAAAAYRQLAARLAGALFEVG